MIAKILILFVVLCAATVWFRGIYNQASDTLGASALLPAINTDASAEVLNQDPSEGYVEMEGIALMDTSGGLPEVPFIQYVTASNALATKQLVFADSRGCAPGAGDIPCVSTSGTSAYPTLVTGQRIRIKGYMKQDRLLIYDIQVIS